MADTAHILVVEDDPQIRRLLRTCFEEEGYRVSEATSGSEVRQYPLDAINLITLDLSLGDRDGLEIARDIRARSNVPIIMITGKGDTIDRVVGLEIGADDYIAKPFHIREVLARVRSVIRRTADRGPAPPLAAQEASRDRYQFDRWVADFAKLEVRSTSGELCDLTTGELKLLEIFVKNPNRILSRDRIMDLLKGHAWAPLDRSIDNQIARLRKKMEPDLKSPRIIRTVRGAGYQFVADWKRV